MADTEKQQSATQKEKAKSKKERAADIAYTTNHALVCTATDFIDPYVGNFIQKKLGNKSQLGNIWAAEVIGDFGAIPLTVGMQRLFPEMMNNLSKFAEPVLGKGFRNGAKRDAKEWALQHGYAVDSEEYKERVERIYSYEINHLPQALMWTASSLVLNVAAQRTMGNRAPLVHITAGKVGGAVLTAGLVIGGRTIFPRKAEKIDKFTSEKFFLPLEDKIEDMIGADGKDEGWSKRATSGRVRGETATYMI